MSHKIGDRIHGKYRCPKCNKDVKVVVWVKMLMGSIAWACEDCYRDHMLAKLGWQRS